MGGEVQVQWEQLIKNTDSQEKVHLKFINDLNLRIRVDIFFHNQENY